MEYNSKLCLEKLKAFQDIKENKIENRYTIKKKKKSTEVGSLKKQIIKLINC